MIISIICLYSDTDRQLYHNRRGTVDVNYSLQINDINYTMKRRSNVSMKNNKSNEKEVRSEMDQKKEEEEEKEINLIRLLFLYLIFVLR